jgi:hypothetical protein
MFGTGRPRVSVLPLHRKYKPREEEAGIIEVALSHAQGSTQFFAVQHTHFTEQYKCDASVAR